jgi:uncharacterized protein
MAAKPDSEQVMDRAAVDEDGIRQYSLAEILIIWAAAALPMALIAWVVAPHFRSDIPGLGLVKPLVLGLGFGLIWQFILVLILVYREQGSLKFEKVRKALWLTQPEDPRSGRVGGWTWLWLIPLLLGFGLEQLIPNFPVPVDRDLATFLTSTAGHQFFAGAWGWFAVMVVFVIFNTVLGEELLFRGMLLPRMHGVFGRADWLANGALFALYHLHMPWTIPVTFIDGPFLLAYPSRRFRSTWLGIIVHSAQSVFILILVLRLVMR